MAERRDEDRPAPGAVLGLCVSVLAMAMLPVAVTGMNLAVPAIRADFESSLAALSWTLSGYSIVLASLTLLGGAVSARLGSWTTFMFGLFVFGLGSLTWLIAPGTAVLVLGRVVQGIGGAMIVPASVTVALGGWPESRRPFAMAVWTAAFPIGSSAAPVLSAILLDLGSWRWIFVMVAVIAGLSLLLGMLLPRADRTGGPPPGFPDLIGMAVGTTAVGLLALGLVQGRSWGWTSVGIVGSLVATAILMPVVVWRSRRHPRPFLALRLFDVPTFRVANIANVAVSMVGISVWLVWPLVMGGLWGYSALRIGLAISPTPVIGGFVSVAISKWTTRHGFRAPLVVGATAILAANLWFWATTEAEPDYWGAMFPGLMLMGLGMGLTFAPLNAAALLDLDSRDFPTGNATFSTGRFLSASIGIAAVVAMIGEGGGTDPAAPFQRAYFLLAAFSVVALAVLVVLWPRKRLATS